MDRRENYVRLTSEGTQLLCNQFRPSQLKCCANVYILLYYIIREGQ